MQANKIKTYRKNGGIAIVWEYCKKYYFTVVAGLCARTIISDYYGSARKAGAQAKRVLALEN